MNDFAPLVWAPAVVTVAYAARGVAVTWLNHRADANKAAAERNEREAGAVARIEGMEREIDVMKKRIDTWIANNGVRR